MRLDQPIRKMPLRRCSIKRPLDRRPQRTRAMHRHQPAMDARMLRWSN